MPDGRSCCASGWTASVSEVFLTGLGLVSPFGVGSHPFFDGLAAGATGAHRPLLQLEGSPLEGQEVGWVPGLEEALGTLPAKLRKFMSEAAILGCLAGREAWDQAALGGRVDPEQVGIYAATGLTAANYESSRELLSSCIDPGGEFSEALLGSRGLASMNPLDSFRILPNMPPCMLAILLGIRGPSLVFNPFEDQGAAALVEAVLAVAQGDVEAALVGAADTPSAPSSLVYLRQSGLLREDEIPSPGAAYFVLESRSSASTLAKITVRPSGTWVDVCGPRMGRAYAAAPALALAAALPAVLAGQQVDVTLPRSFIAIGVPTMTRRVAISGIGVICALGQDPAAFWGEAALGRSGIAPISHFDAGTFEAQLGAEIRGLPELPEELRTWLREDPKVVFGLLAARQALRDAGLEKLPESALLHAGTSLEYFDPRKIVQDGLADFLATVQRCFQPGARPLQVPLDTFTRLLRPGPGRSLVNVSACAASTQAIGHAFRQVRSGATDLALCGGFDSMLNPFGVGGFQLLGALSADMARGARACRPFDAARAGTVLGRGGCFPGNRGSGSGEGRGASHLW